MNLHNFVRQAARFGACSLTLVGAATCLAQNEDAELLKRLKAFKPKESVLYDFEESYAMTLHTSRDYGSFKAKVGLTQIRRDVFKKLSNSKVVRETRWLAGTLKRQTDSEELWLRSLSSEVGVHPRDPELLDFAIFEFWRTIPELKSTRSSVKSELENKKYLIDYSVEGEEEVELARNKGGEPILCVRVNFRAEREIGEKKESVRGSFALSEADGSVVDVSATDCLEWTPKCVKFLEGDAFVNSYSARRRAPMERQYIEPTPGEFEGVIQQDRGGAESPVTFRFVVEGDRPKLEYELSGDMFGAGKLTAKLADKIAAIYSATGVERGTLNNGGTAVEIVCDVIIQLRFISEDSIYGTLKYTGARTDSEDREMKSLAASQVGSTYHFVLRRKGANGQQIFGSVHDRVLSDPLGLVLGWRK